MVPRPSGRPYAASAATVLQGSVAALNGLEGADFCIVGVTRGRVHLGVLPLPEIAVIPSIPNCAKRDEFDNGVHFFQKLTIMAGDDRNTSPTPDEVDHRLATVPVEIVRRFVQQQEIRLGKD